MEVRFLDSFLEHLCKRDPEIEVYPLGELAEIFYGVGLSSEDLSSRGEEAVGVIRPSDLDFEGSTYFIGSPKVFIEKRILIEKKIKPHLEPNDIVLAFSKSQLRLALVGEERVNCIAGEGIWGIRLEKKLNARFLGKLLASEPYREWLDSHRARFTNKNEGLEELQKLLVPVPPQHLQMAVGLDLSREADAAWFLVGMLSEGDLGKFKLFLMYDPIVRQFISGYDKKNKNQAQILYALFQAFRRWKQYLDQGKLPENHLTKWLSITTFLLEEMSIAFEFPPGAERLAKLELLRSTLEKLSALLDEQRMRPELNPWALRQMEAINHLLEKSLEEEKQSLLNQLDFEVKVEPCILKGEKEVILHFRNNSPLPLYQFRVHTSPYQSEVKRRILLSQQELLWPLHLPKLPPGEHFLEFKASFRQFDGKKTLRCLKASFLVANSAAQNPSTNLGVSPYIVGSPVDRPEMFFGRKKVLQNITCQLMGEQPNIILLEGNRRTGKSSILKYLENYQNLPNWIPVYCSFQGAEGDSKLSGIHTKEIYYILAKTIATTLYKHGFSPMVPGYPNLKRGRFFRFSLAKILLEYFNQGRYFERFEDLLALWLELISPKKILLMLDEFDKLQEGIDHGLTSPQVPQNIRYLFHRYKNFSGILSGSRRLKRLREEYWSALFGLGYRIGLDPLEREEAKQLVTNPVQGRLVFIPEARDHVVDLCACQPFLIQSLCNRIFEQCVQRNETYVSLRMVEEAAEEMILDNEHFRTLWDYAATERRRLLLCLIDHYSYSFERASIEVLESKLLEYRILFSMDQSLGDDLDFLRELELIKLDKSTSIPSYKLAVPLMSRWLKKHIDRLDIQRRAQRECREKFLT